MTVRDLASEGKISEVVETQDPEPQSETEEFSAKIAEGVKAQLAAKMLGNIGIVQDNRPPCVMCNIPDIGIKFYNGDKEYLLCVFCIKRVDPDVIARKIDSLRDE